MNITEKDIGRRVWSVTKGWGEISYYGYIVEDPYSVVVTFDSIERDEHPCYTRNGLSDTEDISPELYWQEMEVVEKKMPARQVLYKKTYPDIKTLPPVYEISEESYRLQEVWEEHISKKGQYGVEHTFIRFIDPENP